LCFSAGRLITRKRLDDFLTKIVKEVAGRGPVVIKHFLENDLYPDKTIYIVSTASQNESFERWLDLLTFYQRV